MADKKTVLVVDDSRMSRLMIKTIIATHRPGWKIIEAGDGAQALRVAAEQVIDVATLDMNMPGMDGVTLGAELRKRFPKAEISLITANIQRAVRERAAQAHLTFVPKPISEERLLGYLNGFK
jgi:CheY-like chemotaxis protein